ncbi:MAG: alcohol dehydrogenase catalytic domain-containing protein [Nitriliruptorales bacterium]|nr:alcohol dehydrogenase catalytic domain-containing protein [Nitriliruptorales bacterium]
MRHRLRGRRPDQLPGASPSQRHRCRRVAAAAEKSTGYGAYRRAGGASVKAAIVTEAGAAIEIVSDLEIDQPRTGEALIAIDACGVCGSDLSLLTGKMAHPTPMVLGHEACGTVVALGPDTDGPAAGERVILWMRPPCRTCRMCIRGQGELCEHSGRMSAYGTLLDGRTGFTRSGGDVFRALGIGAFTERLVMPVSGLVPVPDDVPTDVAALLGCGVATGAGAVINVARPQAGDVVVVLGGGGVGQAAAMAAAASSAGAIVVVDPVEERRRQALDLGATHAVEGGDPKALRNQVKAALGDPWIDVVIEAVGRPELVATAHRVVRQGGTVVAVGVQASDSVVALPGQQVALSHKRILGCFMGGIDPQRDMPKLFDLYRRGVLPLDRLITARRPLDEAAAALDDLAHARGLRTVLETGS